MFLELLYKIGIQQRRFCASFGGEFIGKVPGERGNILDPIAKTRDGKRNNVQPVVQIAAELALVFIAPRDALVVAMTRMLT